MKTHELFESLRDVVTRAIEQADRRMPDVITWGSHSSQWQGDEGDYIGYEEVLVDETFKVLGKVGQWPHRDRPPELTSLVFKMVRRYVLGMKRRAG